MAQTRPTPATLPATTPTQLRLFACAALCAGGATLGLIAVLREMSYHALPPARGLTDTTAALCAGIVLGLWIPRRIIRRRLKHAEHGAGRSLSTDPASQRGVGVEFAALLAAALIIAFGVTWTVLCGVAVFMEDYRAFLAQRFLHPAWLTRLLLALPVQAGLVIVGATGTTLLVALHGWYRLAAQPIMKIVRLWVSILLGALAAGLLAGSGVSFTVLAWLAPLVTFIASPIAVSYRAETLTAPPAHPSQQPAIRTELLPLLTAGLAAAAAATALLLTIPRGGVMPVGLGTGVAVLAGAAGVGLLAARTVSRLRFSADLGTLALLLAAVALLFPYGQFLATSANVVLARLAAATCCSAACIVLVGRRVSRANRDVQRALSWVGRFVAGGFGLVMVLASIGAASWNPAVVALIGALVTTAGAGLLLILDSRAKVTIRAAGLIGVGLWLGMVPSATNLMAEPVHAPESNEQYVASRPSTEAARRLVFAGQFQVGSVQPLRSPARGVAPWHSDLTGPMLDVVVLQSLSRPADDPAPDIELGRRLLRRLTTRLAPNGRLMIELPTPPFVAAALDEFAVTARNPAFRGYRLDVRGGTDECEAVVFGADIPALVARHTPVPGWEVSLRPLRAATDRKPDPRVGRGPAAR